MTLKNKLFALMLILALTFAGCEAQLAGDNAYENTSSETAVENAGREQEKTPAKEEAAVQASEPAPTAEPTEPPQPTVPADIPFYPLPPERIPVEIPTSEGRVLEGYYYPSSAADAPVVVLMHWALGSMDDWAEIAPWLQNRLGRMDSLTSGKGARGLMVQTSLLPYEYPGWFPELPVETPFAVLIFNFGGFGNSPSGSTQATKVDDAYAALEFAAGLDGVDPQQISALGASIGADGVVDACYLMNRYSSAGACVGTFSLSPGNYLTDAFTYTEAADSIDAAGYPVWCLAAETDYITADLCRSLTGTHAQSFIYSGGDHGMKLVSPGQYPSEPDIDLNALELVLAWLDEVYGTHLEDAYN